MGASGIPAGLAAWLAVAREPFSLRFVLQPVLAILLGLRDARLDLRAGRPPYVVSIFQGSRRRRERSMEGLRAIAIPLAVAVVLDGVVQVLVDGRLAIVSAIAVGILLVGVPYVLARGLGNRALARVR